MKIKRKNPLPTKPTKQQIADWEALQDEEFRLTRKLAIKSTWHMATKVLWPDVAHKYYWEPLHKPTCDWLDNAPFGSKKCVVYPREHCKTMLLNVARSVREIVRNPNIRILTLSANQKTARKMCGLVKEAFQKNESFRKYFPEFIVDQPKWGTKEDFNHPLRNATGLLDPTYFATYLGAALISCRADILILDDPVDDDDVKNPDLAGDVMQNFLKTSPLIAKSSDYKQRIVIGTPKSFNDIVASLSGKFNEIGLDGDTEKEMVAGWDVKWRHALENEKGEPDLENGEPIMPNVHSKRTLMEELETCRLDENKGEAYFWREYMTVVQSPADQKFQPQWFNSWVRELPPNIIKSYIAIDSAQKDEQILFKGDHMVYLCGHFDNHGHLYLTDAERSNAWTSEKAGTALVAMAQRNNGVYNIIKEKVGDGGDFGQIRSWMEAARKPCNTYPIKVRGMGKKYLRIVDLCQAPIEAGKVHFVGNPEEGKGFPYEIWKQLVQEATKLGMWSKDDVIDCLSLFFHSDVRIRAATNLNTKTPEPRITRYKQVGTARTNPGALRAINEYKRKKQLGDLQNRPQERILTPDEMYRQKDVLNDGNTDPWFKFDR